MVKKSIKIELSSGLEARPAAMLVQVASQYDSKIYLEADSKRVNAKSIMGMMTLRLQKGESVEVVTEGSDEAEADEGRCYSQRNCLAEYCTVYRG